jgi:hypothetical protein
MIEIKKGEDQAEEIMIDYLLLKVQQKDWHGVSDSANDLREMNARKESNTIPAKDVASKMMEILNNVVNEYPEEDREKLKGAIFGQFSMKIFEEAKEKERNND